MLRALTLVAAAVFAAASIARAVYVESGDCKALYKNLYKYVSTEEYFEKNMVQTFVITAYFHVTCKSVGTYKKTPATRYDVVITEIHLGGTVIESNSATVNTHMPSFKERMSKSFQYAQTKDGAIPATYFSREEDAEVANLKKAIVTAFQANFDGTKLRKEVDTQSIHTATYKYSTTLQDEENGVISMQRTITSSDVIGYAQHIPSDEVELKKVEEVTYERGVLTESSGTMQCRLMPKENVKPEDDEEEDNLEFENSMSLDRSRRSSKRKRNAPQNPDAIPSYDASVQTNYYKSKGSYTLELVGQRRLLRRERSARHGGDGDMVESSLLGFINQTRKSMEQMMELRHQLGDIQESLEDLHTTPNKTALAQRIEALLKLEAKYGPLQDYSPVLDDVLEYLTPLLGSNQTNDLEMRVLIYFLISPEGSLRSQLALLDSLNKAVNEEEVDTIVMYIALVANPHPEFVARLETLISSDVHSTDPLLLAYGAVISRASPELQHRMTLFLVDRLPEAETNSSSLIHHILSLGNAGSTNTSTSLIHYLDHPETDVQLVAIFAMRYIMDQPSIHQSLKDLLTRPDTTEDHVTMIVKALVYGTERAKLKHQPRPYSQDLAEALVVLAVGTHYEELHTALSNYLHEVNTQDSLDLLKLMEKVKVAEKEDYANSTRFRRGTQWDEANDVYNLVAPLSERQSDVRTYQHRLSYIWGKQFGGKDINAQVAAGGLAGVSNSGSYKLFGHAVAKANCYSHSLTIVEFLIERQKDSSSTLTRFYSVVMGITLVNVRLTQDSSVCKNIQKPLHEGKKYTVFDFTYSIFVVVGTLNFGLKATIQFTAGMYIEFCENQGSVTVGAGLSPTLTIVVTASGDLEILWVAKAGLSLEATFNYQVLPEITTEVCYKNGQIRVKNCLGVYHQWTDNTLELYAWYAWRGWCGWWVCTGSQAYKNKNKIKGLSVTWNLPGTDKMTIWKTCDQQYTC